MGRALHTLDAAVKLGFSGLNRLGAALARRAALLAALSSPGCTQSSATPLLIVNWWADGSERAALAQLTSRHQESHPTVTVNPDVVGSAAVRRKVGQQLLNDAAPDSFQTNIGSALLRWSRLRKDGVDESPLKDVSDVIDVSELHPDLQKHLVRDNQLFGVPIDLHRTNLIYYNTEKSFASREPERRSTLTAADFTLDRFCTAQERSANSTAATPYAAEEACSGDADGGALTMALLEASWGIQNFVLEELLPAVAGAQFYSDFVAGEGDDVASGEPPVLSDATRDTLTQVLRCARAVRNHVRICKYDSWLKTVNAVSSGAAHFTVGGDWIRGELRRTGAHGVTVRAAPFPVHADDGSVFVYTSDVFPLPVNAPHLAEVTPFLHTVFEPALQIAFSSKKGSVPAITSARKAMAEADDELSTFDESRYRLLATSGLLPAKYPADLARSLEAILFTDEPLEAHLEKALTWFEIGFAEVKTWRQSLGLQ